MDNSRFVRRGDHDHYALFGDGTTSQIADKRRFTSEDGVKKWAFILWPGKKQKAMYDLEDDPLYDKNNDIVRREFDETDVLVVENNPTYTRIWILRSFENEPTHLTEREAYLKEEITYLSREVSSLKSALAKAQEDLHKTRVLTQEAVQDWVDIIKVAGEARGKPSDMMMGEEDQMGAG